MGVGRAEVMRDGLVCSYVVARYRPAGNFLGEFSKNVPRGTFDAKRCSLIAKSTGGEIGKQALQTEVSTPVRRSRIPSGIPASARIFSIDYGGRRENSPLRKKPTQDDAIAEKTKSFWLPNLESGIRGSDIAGLIPLKVVDGEERYLKKYANTTMEELSDSDTTLATNFAAKLREEVKKFQSTKTAEGKSRANGLMQSKKDIDAASIGFQNMEESFKKSQPTLPPEAGVILAEKNTKLRLDASESSNFKQAAELGSARSGESPSTAEIASKVGQAVQKLQNAAQTMADVAATQQAPAKPPIGVVDSAMSGIESANTNTAMSKFAANMISGSAGANLQANGPAKAGAPAAEANTAATNDGASAASTPPVQGALSTNGAAVGGLAGSNAVADNQAALSKVAEEKNAASALYKPTGSFELCLFFLPIFWNTASDFI